MGVRCSGIECHYVFRLLILIEFYFIMIVVTVIGLFRAIIFIVGYMFRLSESKQFWFCECTSLWIYPPRIFPSNIGWIEHVTFGLLYVMFRFSTRIF